MKDPRLGEKVCLAVVFRAGQKVAPADLLDHLDAVGLSKYDMPEYFLRLDEIPLTPNGKMLKRAIMDWIAEGRVTPEPVRFEAVRAPASPPLPLAGQVGERKSRGRGI
jgi:acyl-CoA synthetase (AMP-forming)/AMP-acid ligase II